MLHPCCRKVIRKDMLRRSSRVKWYSSTASYVFKEYFLRFTDPKKLCLKYMYSVLPTSSVARKDLPFQRQAKNEVVHGVKAYPSLQKLRWPTLVSWYSSSRVWCNSSYRLWYLLRQFSRTRRETYTIGSRQNTKEKQAKQYTRQTNVYLFQKSNEFTLDRPRSKCLF